MGEIQGEFSPSHKVWDGRERSGMLAGPNKVNKGNKGDMEAPQKVARKLNVLGPPRLLEGLVEQNLISKGLVEQNLARELLEEKGGEVIKRRPRAWRPIDPKMERLLSTMMIK